MDIEKIKIDNFSLNEKIERKSHEELDLIQKYKGFIQKIAHQQSLLASLRKSKEGKLQSLQAIHKKIAEPKIQKSKGNALLQSTQKESENLLRITGVV